MKSAETRTAHIKVRLLPTERQQLADRAAAAGMSASEYVRVAMMGETIKVVSSPVRASSPEAFELRRIGAMLKSMYPKDSNAWTNREKREWWDSMHKLIAFASSIEEAQRAR
jgi:hypothetical protein